MGQNCKKTLSSDNLAGYGASWQRDDGNASLTWSIEGSVADIYLAPAATLPEV
jgi:hypothetical protein